MDCAPGSGLYAIYVANCALSLDANMSMFGPTCSLSSSRCKRIGFNIHSQVVFISLDSLSAAVLYLPGICSTETRMFLLIHHFRISRAMLLHGIEWLVPMLLIAATAVMLSIFNLIWVLLLSVVRAWSEKRAAFNSRQLICSSDSWADQCPHGFCPQKHHLIQFLMHLY